MTAPAPATIQRASPGDVTELLCDTTGTSMQVGAVLVLDSRLDPAAVRAALAERVTAVPRLRQRLRPTPFGCGRPVWSDDADFDIDRHVGVLGCAAPGGEQDLLDAVARIVMRRLPTDRPLWSATLITGLAAGRSALVVIFHHVLADGIGGLAVLARLVDGAPLSTDPAFPRPVPMTPELLADALRSRGRALLRLPATLRLLRAATVELGAGRPGPAPRTSLNRPVGPLRAIRVARIDLATLHGAARAHGATVNDAVVSAAAGALRSVLAARGEPVDELVFSIPVSARRNADATDLGNQVGVIPIAVPATGQPGPRLADIAAITRRRKTSRPGSSAALFGPVFRTLARLGIFDWFINRQHLVNSFVSNLRGPDRRLHLLGAQVVEVLPVSMTTGNVTVAFSALSYAGGLVVTVIADPERCPDLPALAAAVEAELGKIASAEAATVG